MTSLSQYKLYSFITQQADPSNRAVKGVGQHLFDCWERGFEFLSGHGYSSLVFVLSCEGSDLCSELITFQRKPAMCVIQKPRQ